MERPNTRKRRAEENNRLQAEIAGDLAQLETKIATYWNRQDVYASAHDRRLLSQLLERATEMKEAWNSYRVSHRLSNKG